MNAISIKQPWASLIIEAGKDIENRGWHTAFRGPVLIHASKAVDRSAFESAFELVRSKPVSVPVNWLMVEGEGSDKTVDDWIEMLPRGGIIGRAEVMDCVRHSDSPWFVGPYGHVLANPRSLPFHACRGQLGYWDLKNLSVPV